MIPTPFLTHDAGRRGGEGQAMLSVKMLWLGGGVTLRGCQLSKNVSLGDVTASNAAVSMFQMGVYRIEADARFFQQCAQLIASPAGLILLLSVLPSSVDRRYMINECSCRSGKSTLLPADFRSEGRRHILFVFAREQEGFLHQVPWQLCWRRITHL